MRLPDFLIIGSAKAGTTTLYQYLCQHPQFYQPVKENTDYIPQKPYSYKEPNFFGCDENYAKGINYYASLFTQAQAHQVCGEASTDYTKYPEFPESATRIARHCPHVKLIYIMRHPVERAYSHYVHIGRAKKRTETFEEHIQKNSICLDTSNYMMQIEQYLNFFSRESFLFLLLDDLVKQPTSTLRQVFQFIGIDEQCDAIPTETVVANESRRFFELTTRSKITAPLKALPGVASVTAFLPQSFRDQAYNLLALTPYGKQIKQQYIPPPMRPETRQILLERFKEPNQKLEKFLSRDLSHWFR